MIEDALDMSRIENNKFQMFEDLFNIRDAVNEVSQIMKFQIEEKGLQIHTTVDSIVPVQQIND